MKYYSYSVEILGSLSLSVSCQRLPFAPRNDADSNHWNHKDIDGMSQVAGTDPILVDADASEQKLLL